MKKLLTLLFLLAPSLSFAARLGSLNSTQEMIISTDSLQSGATFYVSSGTVEGDLSVYDSSQNNRLTILTGQLGPPPSLSPSLIYDAKLSGSPSSGQFVLWASTSSYDFSSNREAALLMTPAYFDVSSSLIPSIARFYIDGLDSVDFSSSSVIYGVPIRPIFNSSVGLEIKGQPSQTGNLLNLTNSSGVILSSFSSAGNLTISTITIKTAIVWPDGTVQTSSPTAGGGGSPGGSSSQIQWNNGGSFAGVASSTVDSSGNIGLHATSITSGYTLQLNASAGGKELVMGGVDAVGHLSDNSGVAWILSNLSFGNKQLTFFDNDQVGDGTKWGFRYILGFSLPMIDCINGQINTRGNFSLGYIDENVGVGFEVASAAQSDVKAKLHVKVTNSSDKGFIIQAPSSPLANTMEIQDSGGNVKTYADKNGILAPYSRTKTQLVSEVPAEAGAIYYCSDCSIDGIVVSTGTLAGQFARISARTTAIQ